MNTLNKSFVHHLSLKGLLVNLRAASVLFVFAFAAVSLQAQNPATPLQAGENIHTLAADLTALTARVAKLKGQITAARPCWHL